jgi:hypothetical protein
MSVEKEKHLEELKHKWNSGRDVFNPLVIAYLECLKDQVLAGTNSKLVDAAVWARKLLGSQDVPEEAKHEAIADLDAALNDVAPAAVSYQQEVGNWAISCFGEEIAQNQKERNYRFLEEALELVQSLGCSAKEARILLEYVYSRPIGESRQEVGGVLVTLAALCEANGLDMDEAGKTELKRCWEKIELIRQKQAAKPQRSPLPGQVEESKLTSREQEYKLFQTWWSSTNNQNFFKNRSISVGRLQQVASEAWHAAFAYARRYVPRYNGWDMKEGTLTFSREQWGLIFDPSTNDREFYLKRKRENSYSTADVSANMIKEIMTTINDTDLESMRDQAGQASMFSKPSMPKDQSNLNAAIERLRISSDRDHVDMYFGETEPLKAADIRLVLSALASYYTPEAAVEPVAPNVPLDDHTHESGEHCQGCADLAKDSVPDGCRFHSSE